MFKHQLLVVTIAMLLIAGVAAGQASWVFQDTGFPAWGMGIALGMRGGHTWPVIFTDEQTVALLPTGWHEVGYHLVDMSPRAASSPTGEVAAWSSSGLPGEGRAVVSSPTGWETLAADAMTFDNQGRLWRALGDQVSYRDEGHWRSLPPIGLESPVISIAVASNGEVGVVTSDWGPLYYHHFSPLTGGWTHSDDLNMYGPVMEAPALVFDAHDIPHIVGTDMWQGVAYDFDTRSGDWVTSYLPGSYGVWSAIPVVSDGNGTIGTAYANDMGELFYATNTDNGGWAATMLPIDPFMPPGSPPQAMSGESVGLAYDWAGNPVIAYEGADGNMWLAYDPIVIPEPVTISLLVPGGVALLRKRRR